MKILILVTSVGDDRGLRWSDSDHRFIVPWLVTADLNHAAFQAPPSSQPSPSPGRTLHPSDVTPDPWRFHWTRNQKRGITLTSTSWWPVSDREECRSACSPRNGASAHGIGDIAQWSFATLKWRRYHLLDIDLLHSQHRKIIHWVTIRKTIPFLNLLEEGPKTKGLYRQAKKTREHTRRFFGFCGTIIWARVSNSISSCSWLSSRSQSNSRRILWIHCPRQGLDRILLLTVKSSRLEFDTLSRADFEQYVF